MSLPETLKINHFKITASLARQFMVVTALDDLALIEHVDDIRLLDRAQSMRDGDRGAASCGCIQRRLHDFFGLRIQRRCGFV